MCMKTRFAKTILLLVAFLNLAGNCFAQSMPLLNDPLKVKEIELITEKIEMTNVQVESILEVYDGYLVEFAIVRNDEVKKFEDALTEAAETFGFMNFEIPERKMVEDLISNALRAMKAIQRTDNSFFENITGMLTDKQASKLQRIRLARELRGYEISVMEMISELNRGSRTHLKKLYDQINPEPNEEINALLDSYSKKYLRNAKEGLGIIVEVIKLALDMIDELGIRGLDQQSLMMRFMDEEAIIDLKRRGDILLAPLSKKSYEISQLNWKTWNQIDGLLTDEDALKLHKLYFNKSFSRVMGPASKVSAYFDLVLDFDGIDELQRKQLVELQTSFNVKWKRKSEKHAEVVEKSRKEKNIAQMSGELGTEFDDELDKLSESGKEYASSIEKKINSILGPEIIKAMEDSKNERKKDTWFGSATYRDGSTEKSSTTTTTNKKGEKIRVTEKVRYKNGEVVETERIETPVQNRDNIIGGVMIPKSIDSSFPTLCATITGLDESGISIVEAVYEDYLEEYKSAYDKVAKSGEAITAELELTDGARLKKIRDASKEVASEVAQLDKTFFDNLSIVTGLERDDKNLLVLEHHRVRQRSLEADNVFGWVSTGEIIDLVELYILSKQSIELQSISDDAKSEILSAMQSYHSNVNEHHKTLVEALYTVNHIQDVMRAVRYGENGTDNNDSFTKRWQDAYKDLRDAKRALILANQNVMDQILNVVPQDDFWAVRMEFVKKTYPDVFEDKLEATKLITAASSIKNLELVQQNKLEELATSYRYDYWNICEAMIENHQENASAKSADKLMNQEDMKRALKLETLKFERKELNDRVRMRLRMVLNEDQIKHVPGLRPSVASAMRWD